MSLGSETDEQGPGRKGRGRVRKFEKESLFPDFVAGTFLANIKTHRSLPCA